MNQHTNIFEEMSHYYSPCGVAVPGHNNIVYYSVCVQVIISELMKFCRHVVLYKSYMLNKSCEGGVIV